MRSLDLPYLNDWAAVTLRWLTLLGLAMTLALTGHLDIPTGAVLVFILIWNLFISVMAILNRRIPGHRPVNLVIDVIAAMALFWLSGGIQGMVAWSGFLALFSASIYFGVWGGVITAVVLSLAELDLTYLQSSLLLEQPTIMFIIGINIISGLVLGFLSRLVVRLARSTYKRQVVEQAKIEQNVIRQEHDRIQAFYSLTATMSTTLNYQRVLDTVLDLGAKVMDDDPESAKQIVSAVLLFEEDQLKIGSCRRMSPADQRAPLPGHNGLLAKTIQSADPQVINNNIAEDPELGRLVALRSCQSAVCQTMRSGLDVFGLLLFAHPNPNYFTADRCEVLEIISQQAVIAIQNARLYENLEKEKERLIDSQEEARKKLARDLHDGPTQTVAAIAMRLDLARRLVRSDPAATSEELLRIEEMARRTTKEIRHMLFTLRPLVLETQGLVAALQANADKMRETFNQNVIIEVDEEVVTQLEVNRQTVIFFIVEEAVNNARKYAQAAHIWVRLKMIPHEKEVALLEIRDDGVGFDVKTVNASYENRGSLGLINLRDRSELINSLFHIDSTIGEGTLVQVFIPLSDEAADRLHRGIR